MQKRKQLNYKQLLDVLSENDPDNNSFVQLCFGCTTTAPCTQCIVPPCLQFNCNVWSLKACFRVCASKGQLVPVVCIRLPVYLFGLPAQQNRMFVFFHFKINNMVNRSFELQVWWPFFCHKMKTKTASTKALGFYFTKGLKLQEVSLQDTESAHLVCFTAHRPT